MDVRVTGARDLARVAGVLNRAQPEIRKALTKTLRQTAKPSVEAVRAKARSTMPAAGGLNEFVATAKIGVRITTSGKGAGMRIVGTKSGHDIHALDRGRLRHPLFGNRRHWFQQAVPPGFFSETLANEQRELTSKLVVNLREYMGMLSRL